MAVINETGNRYGKIVVGGRVKYPIHNSRVTAACWHYICDCGNEGYAIGTSLRHGDVMSCGCSKFQCKDETGNRYGCLTVIERVLSSETRTNALWKCVCDCGKETIVSGSRLRNGGSHSCGCLRNKWRTLPSGSAGFNDLYRKYQSSASKRNHTWGLDKEKFRAITNSNCYYCGSPPSQVRRSKHSNGEYVYNGIDRVDNSVGYIDGNVVACCGKCNYAKHEMTTEQFVQWICSVYIHFVDGK